jgi:hypothetical protein
LVTKDHVVSLQGNDKDIDDELFLIGEDVDCPTDASGGDTVTVRHDYLQVGSRQRLKVKPAGHGDGDE